MRSTVLKGKAVRLPWTQGSQRQTLSYYDTVTIAAVKRKV